MRDRSVVVRDAESEAAVLLRNLHAPGAELAETLENLLGILAGAIDLVGIDVFGEEAAETFDVLIAHRLVFLRLLRERVDEIEIEVPKKEVTDERRLLPFGFATGLGDFHRFDCAGRFRFFHDGLLQARLGAFALP